MRDNRRMEHHEHGAPPPQTGPGGDQHAHDHDHSHGHSHDHAQWPPRASTSGWVRRWRSICCSWSLKAALAFCRIRSRLIADAGHNLGDVLGLICAWTAMFLARRPPGGKFTYGLGRSSLLAALTNAVLLLMGCGAIAWEALGRITAPPAVAGATVAGVAAIGIVLNGISAWLLHGGSHDDLNRRSAFIHMLGDAAVSAGVLISGLTDLVHRLDLARSGRQPADRRCDSREYLGAVEGFSAPVSRRGARGRQLPAPYCRISRVNAASRTCMICTFGRSAPPASL